MWTFMWAHRFWNILRDWANVAVSAGTSGPGEVKTTQHASEAEAIGEHDRLIAEKLAEGYVETTGRPFDYGFTSPLRKALEDALAEAPDDLATHMAYADHLTELGDPRGEFVRTQLALEDESLKAAQRRTLRRREQALLKRHER